MSKQIDSTYIEEEAVMLNQDAIETLKVLDSAEPLEGAARPPDGVAAPFAPEGETQHLRPH